MKTKITIKSKVEAAQQVLISLDCAGLTRWGIEHGCDSQAAFSAYKKALLTIGVDYNAIRINHRAERAAEISKEANYEVTLITDATAARFSVCDEDGEPLWYGRFFDGEGGEQSAGEKAAALKAIWLASKIKETLNAAAIRLTLLTDAEWLCWGEFSADGKRGGKARQLGETAVKYGIDLHVQHISGFDNPADRYSRTHGFKKWTDNNLSELASLRRL